MKNKYLPFVVGSKPKNVLVLMALAGQAAGSVSFG
jgi:hypothetical protein